MRSLTCRPVSRRACWTARTRSRARPSEASSGVTAVSRTTKPPEGSIAVAPASAASPATTVSRAYSPSTSARPPAVTVPSASTLQSPDLLPLMARWTSLPSRGPAARALTVRRWLTPKSASLAVATSTRVNALTLSSSWMIPRNGSSARRLGSHDRQLGERQARPQAPGLAQAGRRRADLAGPVHRDDELVVGRQVVDRRVVGEVHRPLAGQPAPDLLGDERQQRGRGARDGLERRPQRVERRERLVGLAAPEPVAGAADVPVRQHVEEAAHRVARGGDLVGVELLGHVADELAQLGEQVAVEDVGRGRRALRLVALAAARGVGVEREERPGVPQRDHHLAHAVADALLGDDEVAAAQDRAAHEEPAHGVGAVAVEDLARRRGSCAATCSSSGRRSRARCRG